jgi:hypothetical protein
MFLSSIRRKIHQFVRGHALKLSEICVVYFLIRVSKLHLSSVVGASVVTVSLIFVVVIEIC